MAAAFQQQIFALDARFNSYRAPNLPNFKTLYIRRRSQLLRENAKFKDIETIKRYLTVRTQLLQRKYGVNDSLSISSASSRVRSNGRLTLHDDSNRLCDVRFSLSTAENYAFTGVHHIFDQHKEQVSLLKFAHNDRSTLCCGSHDGTLSICDVTSTPPQVKIILKGHTDVVTGFDWSASNELLVSCSHDSWLKLWTMSEGKCLRSVKDQLGCALLCCVFQPSNNNMVILGNSKGMIQVLNISTGIYSKGGTSILGGRVISITCDNSGTIFWAANDKGIIISYAVNAAGGLSKLRRCIVGNSPLTCISWSPWLSRHPALLVNSADNSLYLFRVIDNEGTLCLRQRYNNMHTTHNIRSTFCPIMSFRRSTCVVTGSEDSCVYFLDVEGKPNSAVINKLQGHASPVIAVTFNYDESLLATSDVQGLVIIWRRS